MASKELEDLHGTLCDMRAKDKITDNIYYKGVVSLAYEHAVDSDLVKATGLLSEIPASYFANVMGIQMKADVAYCILVTALSQSIVGSGLVVLDDFKLTSSKRAQA